MWPSRRASNRSKGLPFPSPCRDLREAQVTIRHFQCWSAHGGGGAPSQPLPQDPATLHRHSSAGVALGQAAAWRGALVGSTKRWRGAEGRAVGGVMWPEKMEKSTSWRSRIFMLPV